MTDLFAALGAMRRPRLLIRAARFGLTDYDRSRDLKRVIKTGALPSPAVAVSTLIEEEAQIDAIRRAGDASYSVARHVDVLIALMAEAALLPRKPARVA